MSFLAERRLINPQLLFLIKLTPIIFDVVGIKHKKLVLGQFYFASLLTVCRSL